MGSLLFFISSFFIKKRTDPCNACCIVAECSQLQLRMHPCWLQCLQIVQTVDSLTRKQNIFRLFRLKIITLVAECLFYIFKLLRRLQNVFKLIRLQIHYIKVAEYPRTFRLQIHYKGCKMIFLTFRLQIHFKGCRLSSNFLGCRFIIKVAYSF